MKLPVNSLRQQMGMPSANCRYASWDEVPGLSHLTDEDYEAIKALTLESQYEGWWLEDRDYLEFLQLEDCK